MIEITLSNCRKAFLSEEYPLWTCLYSCFHIVSQSTVCCVSMMGWNLQAVIMDWNLDTCNSNIKTSWYYNVHVHQNSSWTVYVFLFRKHQFTDNTITGRCQLHPKHNQVKLFIAQVVEHQTYGQVVPSSNPSSDKIMYSMMPKASKLSKSRKEICKHQQHYPKCKLTCD